MYWRKTCKADGRHNNITCVMTFTNTVDDLLHSRQVVQTTNKEEYESNKGCHPIRSKLAIFISAATVSLIDMVIKINYTKQTHNISIGTYI